MTHPFGVLLNSNESAHWMLQRVLKRGGIERSQVKVYTLDTQWLPQLEADGVRALVVCGEDALDEVIGSQEIERWMGRAMLHPWGRVIIPTMAPSKLLIRRGVVATDDDEDDDAPPVRKRKRITAVNPPRFTGMVIEAFQRAQRLAQQDDLSEVTRREGKLICDPTPWQFDALVRSWRDNWLGQDEPLGFDIETAFHLKQKGKEDADLGIEQDKRVIRISFAVMTTSGIEAVSVPWDGPYIGAIRQLLRSTNPKVGWNNWGFDEPVLFLNGEPLEGPQWDAQDAWHLLYSDLPKGLEFASGTLVNAEPWKHLGDHEPAKYSALDADITLDCWFELRRRLEAAGLWALYQEALVDVHVVTTVAERNGIPLDREKQRELGVEFEHLLAERLLEAQRHVPEAVKAKKLYVKVPKGEPQEAWAQATATVKVKQCKHCGKQRANRKHKCPEKPDGWVAEHDLTTVELGQDKWYRIHPTGNDLASIQAWLKGNGFNPNSSKQMLGYMTHFRHPLGRNHKTDADSADTKHLEKLSKKYPKHGIYALTVDIHKLSKAVSQYINGMVPDAQGILHTQYTNAPSTLRFSSRAPNLQNISKRAGNPYAKRARAIFVSKPGWSLVQADWISLEAVLQGYFMNDPEFIKLAKQSIHTFLCCKHLGLPFPGASLEETVELVKAKHNDLYNKMKTTTYLSSYGGSPYMMHMTDPGTFPTLRDATQAQDIMFNLFPKMREYQYLVRVRAQKESKLTNPYGFSHSFYDVFTYKYDDDGKLELDDAGQPKLKHGKDSKRVVALNPQSTGAFAMRYTLRKFLEPANLRWLPYLPATLTVHDAVMLHVPDEMVDEAVQFLHALMTAPHPQLGGLRIGCEIEVGKNWKEMRSVLVDRCLEG